MGIFDNLIARKRRMALTDISWSETSGVDHPANLEEGWIVMKAADQLKDISLDDLAQLAAQEEAWITKASGVLAPLMELDLSEAPEDVQKARKKMAEYLEESLGMDEEPDDDEDDAKGKKGMRKGVIGALLDLIRGQQTAEPTAEQVAKAFDANLDNFAHGLAEALLSGDTSSRSAAITEALAAFRKEVETTLGATTK